MKFAFVHPLMDQRGGAEILVIEQAEHLARKGHDVSVFTDAFNGDLFHPAVRSSIRIMYPTALHTRYSVLSYGLDLAQRRMLEFRKDLRQAIENFGPDVVVAQNFPALGVCRGLEKRTLHYCNEPPYLLYGKITHGQFSRRFTWKARFSNSLMRAIDRRAVGSAHRIFAISEFTRSLVRKCYGKESRVLYPGIDTSTFQPSKEKGLRAELGLESSRVVMTCTRLHKIKGVEDFLLVLHRLRRKYPDVRGIVSGWGPEEADLWRLTKQLRMSGYILFLRGLPRYREQLRDYYSIADVVVYPSYYEPFGLVPLEAMSCERPVVAYNQGGPAETIVNESTGLLAEVGNVPNLSNCVSRIFDDPDLGVRMGKEGRKRVEHVFSWKTHTAAIESECLT